MQVTEKPSHQTLSFENTQDLHLNSYERFTNKGTWTYSGKNTAYQESYTPPALENVVVAHSKDEPMQVQKRIQKPLENLFADAESNGHELIIASAYRSIQDQRDLYDRFVATQGAEAAAEFVATPGESEHHTGLAIDIDTYTPECEQDSYTCTLHPDDSKWLRDNAWKHGFILRYPAGAEHITGIAGETWHYRYVGRHLAALLYQANLTFDEFIATAAPGRINIQ